MNKRVGIYFDKGGGTRGGPYVRAKLLEKYIPYVEIFNDINKAKDYEVLDFQWRVPKQLNKYPHISTFHGILPLNMCSNLHAKAAMWYRIKEQKQILKTALKIIAVSDEAKRQVQTLTNNKNIDVVYAGLECDNYRIKRKEDSIMFLNSLERYENLQVILKALKEQWSGYLCDSLITSPPFVLDVYGYGRMQKQFEKEIEENLLPVNIKEEVDNNIIIDELSRAKCLIQPALQETFGLPICEAMASGTIVIASDIPSHRENFENVLFFEPNNHKQLAKLIHEVMIENKHKELIPKALAEVKRKYNVKRFIEQTKKVYEDLK